MDINFLTISSHNQSGVKISLLAFTSFSVGLYNLHSLEYLSVILFD